MLILRTVEECIEKTIEKLINIGGYVKVNFIFKQHKSSFMTLNIGQQQKHFTNIFCYLNISYFDHFLKDIVAVGVTNQRETTIVWDKESGKPMHNAIVWLDMRTSTTVDQLLDNVPNKSRNKNYLRPLCGLPLSPYFSAVKLRWLKDNDANIGNAIRNGTCLFGTVDSWLLWHLTGGPNGGCHVTDVTNASRTMLMNIESLRWDPHLLKFFDIPISVLPEIRSSSEVYGVFADGPLKVYIA